MKRLAVLMCLLILAICPELDAQVLTKNVSVNEKEISVKISGVEDRKILQPLVILETGLSDAVATYDALFDQVSEFAPVLTYQRPALTASELDDAGMALKNQTLQLHDLLNQLDLPPPYILVGHKLGGVFAQGFVQTYPDEVAGIVYLDPTGPTGNLEKVASNSDELSKTGDVLVEKIPSSQILRRYSDDPRESEFLARLLQEEKFSWEKVADNPIPSILMLSRKNNIFSFQNSVSEEDRFLALSLIENRNSYFQDLTSGMAHFSLVLSSSSYSFLPLQATTSVALSIQEVIYAESTKKIVAAAEQLSVEDFAGFTVGLRSYIPNLLLSERELNMLGYSLIRRDLYEHALVLFEDNLKNHSSSANVYDSYGDGLMALERVEEAAVYYEKAVELGRKSNHRDLGLFIKNLERSEGVLNK